MRFFSCLLAKNSLSPGYVLGYHMRIRFILTGAWSMGLASQAKQVNTPSIEYFRLVSPIATHL